MRFAAAVFVLVASLAVISPSYSSPVPSQGDSTETKRDCLWPGCRIETNTTSPGQGEVQELVGVLIDALTLFQGDAESN
ncbi:hypothetical protein BGY98DRAFT_1002085 [Russula aff. rugulosa BPL654]|nr:hypothetical protein BGY98DRAFT_1002085 [Russula aff. rugulosa BPL654]